MAEALLFLAPISRPGKALHRSCRAETAGVGIAADIADNAAAAAADIAAV